MRHRSRLVGQFCALIVTAALVGAGAPAPHGSDVQVTVTGLRSHDGVVLACMTSDPQRFPKCRGADAAHSKSVPASDHVTLTFRNVQPGTYAIALLHDENGNGKADRALMMMPTEGFGFSRDAKVKMGPPHFKDAAFEVNGKAVRQTIRMRYML